jgi:hypothetical protein
VLLLTLGTAVAGLATTGAEVGCGLATDGTHLLRDSSSGKSGAGCFDSFCSAGSGCSCALCAIGRGRATDEEDELAESCS